MLACLSTALATDLLRCVSRETWSYLSARLVDIVRDALDGTKASRNQGHTITML